MPKTTTNDEDLSAKLADLGRAGSHAMQPAVTRAMTPSADTPRAAKAKGKTTDELIKITVRLTHEENRRLIRFRNELSEQHGQALNTTDVLRLALNVFDQKRITPELVGQIQSTDRRRKAE